MPAHVSNINAGQGLPAPAVQADKATRRAFTMIMIFSIILSVFAVNFIIWGIPAGVRVFESKGIFKLMRLHRSVWWGEMLILGSVLVLAMLSFLAALFGTHMGVVWLRDREDGVKHLARRITRMSTFHMAYTAIFKICVVWVCVHLFMRRQYAQASIALALTLFSAIRWLIYTSRVCKYLLMHEQALESEYLAVRYAVGLLVASLTQFFMSGLLSGYSAPQGDWDQRGALMNTVSVASVIVSLLSGSVGFFLATGFLLTNGPTFLGGALRNTPFVAAAYKILLAANCAVLLFGGPIMFIVDAVNFAAHDHRLSEASNFWIVLRQPLFTVVVVGAQIVLSLSFVSVTGFDPGHAEEFDRAALYAHMGQARVYDQGLEIAEP